MRKGLLLVVSCWLLAVGSALAGQGEKVKITITGEKVKVENPVKGVTVTNKGGHVTIVNKIEDREIDFNIKGETNDGSITYQGTYKTTLKLKGLKLVNPQGSAIDVQCGKRIKLQLDDASYNSLTDGKDTLHSGCIQVKGHLEISGDGSLTITANQGPGIKTKEYCQLKRGKVTINAVGDGCKGIRSKEDVIIDGGELNITTTGNYLSEGQPNFMGMGGGMPQMGDFDGDFGGGFGGGPMGGDFKPDSTMMGGGFPGGPMGGGFGDPMGGGFPGMPEGVDADSLRRMFEKMFKDFKPDSTMMGGEPGRAMGGFGGPMGGGFSGGPMGGMPGGFNPDSMMMGGPDGGMGGPGGGGGRHFYEGTAKGIKALGTVTINGGIVVVRTSTGGAEGIEGKKGVVINGGTVDVKAQDDAINSNGKICFNGGKTTAWSKGNDAVDSNYRGAGAITISGGETYVMSQLGPPDEGFDCDFSPVVMTGGTAFSMGGSMGFEVTTPRQDENCPPFLVMQGTELTEGKTLNVVDEAGKSVFQFKIPFTMRQSFGFVSCPAMQKGKTYKIVIN